MVLSEDWQLTLASFCYSVYGWSSFSGRDLVPSEDILGLESKVGSTFGGKILPAEKRDASDSLHKLRVTTKTRYEDSATAYHVMQVLRCRLSTVTQWSGKQTKPYIALTSYDQYASSRDPYKHQKLIMLIIRNRRWYWCRNMAKVLSEE